MKNLTNRFMLHYLMLWILTCFLLLTGCSYVHSDKDIFYHREKDYLQATQAPPLVIPPGLASQSIEAHYPVSEKKYSKSNQPIDLTPPEITGPLEEKAARYA